MRLFIDEKRKRVKVTTLFRNDMNYQIKVGEF